MNDIDDIQNLSQDDLLELLDDFTDNNKVKNTENLCIDDEPCNIVQDIKNGTIVCKKCGQVKSEIIDNNPEWRKYSNSSKSYDNSRCKTATNFFLPRSSLGSTIGGCNNKLKTLQIWGAMPYKERSLNIVLKEISSRCKKGKIVKCIEDEAKIMYKNIDDCKHIDGKSIGKNIITRGSNRKSLIAACVYFACKKRGLTRSVKEIADIFELRYTEVTKGCKNFLKLIELMKVKYKFKSSLPHQFVPRYCIELNINGAYREQAVKIAKNASKLNLASVHTPLSIATGSILLMAEINNLSITKKSISDKFGVSDVTITKAYKKMFEYLPVLVNDDATDKLIDILKKERSTVKQKRTIKEFYNNSYEKEYKKMLKLDNKKYKFEIIDKINITNKEYLKIKKLV